MIDSIRAIETPEGVGLDIRPAGPGPRMIALLLDYLIRAVAYLIVLIPLMGMGILGNFGQGLGLIFIFCMEWFYPVLFEMLYRGQTPGKKMMDLMVLHDDGSPLSWRASILRNFMRTVDFLPMGYMLGFISVLVTGRFQRLGDLVAGTVVVYQEEIGKHGSLPEVTPKPQLKPLRLEEQRAMIAFAERSSRLSLARSEELAEIIRDYTGTDGEKGVDVIYANAAWLIGRRP